MHNRKAGIFRLYLFGFFVIAIQLHMLWASWPMLLSCSGSAITHKNTIKLWDEKSLQRKNKAAVILKTGRFIALHTRLMMTAESMLSKRPVLRITAALFFLLKLLKTYLSWLLQVADRLTYNQGFHRFGSQSASQQVYFVANTTNKIITLRYD